MAIIILGATSSLPSRSSSSSALSLLALLISNCQRQPRHRAYECIARRSPDHPKTDQVGTQIHSKIEQNGRQNGSKSLPRGLLEGSGGVLGPSWLQDGPKKQKTSENQFLGPPLGRHVGTQNPRIEFWNHFVPTWLQLGRQNPSKIDPSWLQDASKKRSRC